MDDELDVAGGRKAHFEHSPGLVGTDEHRKLVELALGRGSDTREACRRRRSHAFECLPE